MTSICLVGFLHDFQTLPFSGLSAIHNGLKLPGTLAANMEF